MTEGKTIPEPSGWKLVPVEPTKAQIELLAKAYDRSAFDPEEDGPLDVAQPRRDRCLFDARKLFDLLLAASPEPPVSAPGHTDLMVSPESIDAFLEANPLPPEQPVSGWLPIEAAPSAKSVLVAYKNCCDKWRVVKAVRYEQYQNEQPSDDDEGEVGEYCEEKDAYFVRAGWYELIDNWDDFGFVAIYEGDPVAWMNLPAPPKQQEPK